MERLILTIVMFIIAYYTLRMVNVGLDTIVFWACFIPSLIISLIMNEALSIKTKDKR